MAVCPERTRLTKAYMDAATVYEAASRRVMELGADLGILDSVWAEAREAGRRAHTARRILDGHIERHGCDVVLADESTVAGSAV